MYVRPVLFLGLQASNHQFFIFIIQISLNIDDNTKDHCFPLIQFVKTKLKRKSTPRPPKTGNRLVHLIRMDKSTGQIWVNVRRNTTVDIAAILFVIADPKPTKRRKVATVAWVLLFGDAFHKFIDGISVGAAFSESVFAGISVALAVICEEIPHELGTNFYGDWNSSSFFSMKKSKER